MNNSLVDINSRFELAEERISKFEDRSIETMQFEEQKERRKINRALENCEILTYTLISM